MKKIIYSLLLTTVMLTFVACHNQPTTRTFLIPSGCEGTLRIIYGEKCGEKPTVENNQEVFTFQKNGFLIIAADVNSQIKNEYFLIDGSGNKTSVTEISNTGRGAGIMPAIAMGGLGVSSSNANYTDSKLTAVSGGAAYMDLQLYNKSKDNTGTTIQAQKLDSLTNALVNACRENK